jgi:branched-subunit amino acid aminotransferase/4-amino-4-deoxychorismate lyase
VVERAQPVELDGEPVTAEQAAALGTLAHGHITVIAVDDLRVQGLALHWDRLVRDHALVFGATLDPDRVRTLVHRVAGRCEQPSMLRVTLFDRAGSVARPGPTAAADSTAQPNVLITSRALVPDDPSRGLRVRTADFVRDLPAVKHLGTFGQLHQRRLAQLAGFDDALFCTGPEPSALVCEGPTWNIALLLGDELVWPDDHCLPGLTRDLLHRVRPSGLTWSNRPVTRAELAGARAAFATSAGIGVMALTQIDDAVLPGDSALLDELRAGYTAIPGDLLTA